MKVIATITGIHAGDQGAGIKLLGDIRFITSDGLYQATAVADLTGVSSEAEVLSAVKLALLTHAKTVNSKAGFVATDILLV